MRRGSEAILGPGGLDRSRILPLLLVHLIEWLSYDVILCPVDGRATDDILRLWYRRHSRLLWLRTFGVYRVVASLLVVVVVIVGLGIIGKGRGQSIRGRLGGSGFVLLQRAHEALRIGNGGLLELFEGLEIALALLALQLEQ